jgi:PAS domain S-box-containing protein
MKEKIKSEIDWRIRVFDSLSFPTLILKPDRTIVSANQIFLKKIGADLADIVGRPCRDIFRQYDQDPGLPCSQQNCPLQQTLKYREGSSVLRHVTNQDGSQRWEDRVFSPILDEDDNVIYVIESVRDITRTKNLEKMYNGIRAFLKKVIESSPSAIVAADNDGKLLLMNEAAEELFGYSFSDAERIRITDLYPRGVAQKIMEKLRSGAYGGRGKLPVTQENILSASGEQIPVEMTGAIIYEGDLEVATMAIYNDLRLRLEVEKKLQDAQKQVLQSEKLASLGRLAAGVAHEINNPLTGILLYGNMMLEKVSPSDPLRQHLQYILEDSERCRDIVQNLLAYSRQTNPAKETFHINTLVEESLVLIRDQKLFMNVRIEKELSGAPIVISADRNQMRQVIINLVINALDAMEKRGVLTLRTFPGNGGRVAVLEISDTGKGISEENRSRIFDPFFTTKEPGRGTGLGLSTVYGIVKENQGNILLKETGPEGTTFRLEMPLAGTAKKTEEKAIG